MSYRHLSSRHTESTSSTRIVFIYNMFQEPNAARAVYGWGRIALQLLWLSKGMRIPRLST